MEGGRVAATTAGGGGGGGGDGLWKVAPPPAIGFSYETGTNPNGLEGLG